MFLLNTNFRKYLCILLIITILLGTCLVTLGGYITDKYFSEVVSGVIGDYGEYDLLLTLARDKEDIALEQVHNVIDNTFPGAELKEGPKVAGSSNYIMKLPKKYKNEEIYYDIDRFFAGIPGLISETIITEPRLSLRGFRGKTLDQIRPKIEEISGVEFTYRIGDGIDLIIEKPEIVPDVKKKAKNILGNYELFEVRYPLNHRPDSPQELKQELTQLLNSRGQVSKVIDVTSGNNSDQMAMLKNLTQMKTFLLSYATKIIIEDVEDSENITKGSELIIPLSTTQAKNTETSNKAVQSEEKQNQKNNTQIQPEKVILRVIENKNGKITALLKEGSLKGLKEPRIYQTDDGSNQGSYLGIGKINNPRADLANTLSKLNEIEPMLNGFLEQSGQLVEYSNQLSKELKMVNQGLNRLEDTSKTLNSTMEKWQQEDISRFLKEVMALLDELKNNAGDINQLQGELIKTSNRLKEAAGMIEEKIVFVPRDNDLYQQLKEMKDLFLRLSSALDNNYDVIASRMENMDPLLTSVDQWKGKINSLLNIESTLNKGMKLQEIESVISRVDQTAETLDTRKLQDNLSSIRELLLDIKTSHLPAIIEQLEYIQQSLPNMKEHEIIDTLDLIDKYMAGRVIPGEQVQLLVKGEYDKKDVIDSVKEIIKKPGVSYYNMNAGMVSTNPRAEVFNILRQVRAVISIIIALIFTLLVMMLDQTLLISVLNLNGRHGYLYSFIVGGLIFSSIYALSGINFPYLNIYFNILIGGTLGFIIGLFSSMLNPVNKEEWEAGKTLGFSFAEIMHEIVIPTGKPGLLYLMNYPKVIFK